MDVSTLKVADRAAIHVKSATGEPLYEGDKPVRIILHSPGSRAHAAVESRQTARAVRRHNENEGKLAAFTAEERLRESAEDLAAVTVRFEGLTCGDLQGPALFEAVYGDPALGYITNQVTKALKDWGTFGKASASA